MKNQQNPEIDPLTFSEEKDTQRQRERAKVSSCCGIDTQKDGTGAACAAAATAGLPAEGGRAAAAGTAGAVAGGASTDVAAVAAAAEAATQEARPRAPEGGAETAITCLKPQQAGPGSSTGAPASAAPIDADVELTAEEEVEEAPAPGSIPARLDQPRLVLPEPERAPERVPEPPER